jgi:hypothetical protein
MQRQFLGATFHIPAEWQNQSFALFVAPREKKNSGLMTAAKERELPAMTVAVTPPRSSEGLGARAQLDRTLDEAKRASKITVEDKGEQTTAERECAWAVVVSQARDGTLVRQLMASVREGELCVGFVGTAEAAGFANVRSKLLEILGTLQISNEAATASPS